MRSQVSDVRKYPGGKPQAEAPALKRRPTVYNDGMQKLLLAILLVSLVILGGCSKKKKKPAVKVARIAPSTTAQEPAKPAAPEQQDPPQYANELEEPEITEPLSLFSRQHLLRVDIKIADQAWATLRSQTRSMASALSLDHSRKPFTYFRGDVTINGTTIQSVGIRKKGFIGSLDDQRPSLKIKFNHFDKKSQRTYEGVDRLTLNNNKQDRSLASQYLSYHLFRKASIPAPRCNLAVVTVNGEKLGIYSNVEAVKTNFVKQNFGTTEGTVFEGTLADFFPDRLTRFDPKVNKKWAKKEGKKMLEQLAKLLNPDDDRAIAEIEKHVDMQEFLTFWVIESLIGFWDGYSGNQNNFFVYVNPQKPKIQFIPWGIDAAFTSRRVGFRRSRYKSVFTKGLLANRLNRDSGMRQRYHETMAMVFATVWDEDELIGDTNRLEWLVRSHLHPRQEQFREALQQIRRFIENRREEVWAEVEDGPIEVGNSAGKPMHTETVGVIQGSFRTKWQGNSWTPIQQGRGTPVNGNTHGRSFSLSGATAIASMGSARRWNRGSMKPTITIRGKRSDDDREISITIVVPTAQFKKGQTVKVQGRLSNGQRRGWGSGMLDGSLTITRAASQPGAAVEGKFKMRVYEMQRW